MKIIMKIIIMDIKIGAALMSQNFTRAPLAPLVPQARQARLNQLFKENCKNPYSMRDKGISKIKYELSHYTERRPSETMGGVFVSR